MAILGCVLGGFGFLCSPFNAIGFLVGNPDDMAPTFAGFGIPVPQFTPTAKIMMILNSLFATAISLVQLIGCGGSFAMKPWARKCINVYAALQILNSLFYSLISVIFLIPSMTPQLASMNPAAASPGMMTFVTIISALMYFLMGSCFAILYLFIYNTRANREAFANSGVISGHPYYAPAPPPGYGYSGGYYAPGQQPPAGAPGYQQPPQPQYQQAPPPQYPQAPPGYQQVPPGYQPVPQGPPRDPGPLPPPPQQPPQYPPQG
jgi:hypothetical protein